jgi:ketosteroid isomerase-like protein
MKKLCLAVLVAGLFAACQKAPVRYTQQSAEIDAVKAMYDAYLAKDWEKFQTYYAGDAKIFWNKMESDPQTLQELVAQEKESLEELTTYSQEHLSFEMVLDDEGETWVNYWGIWRSTLKMNGKSYETPIHETFQFIDGKIIKEYGYWDSSKFAMAEMEHKMRTDSTMMMPSN